MDDFDCTTAGRAIAAYVEELSNWYVRLSRRRFWDGRPGGVRDPAPLPARGRRSCSRRSRPFLADEIYDNLSAGRRQATDSVHLCDFPEPDAALIDAELEAGMEAVRRTVELGRAARAQAKVKSASRCAGPSIVATEAERERDRARSPTSSRPS